MTVGRVKFREDFTEVVGCTGELDKEGEQQVAGILLVSISEIKVEEGEGGQSISTHVPDLLDDC